MSFGCTRGVRQKVLKKRKFHDPSLVPATNPLCYPAIGFCAAAFLDQLDYSSSFCFYLRFVHARFAVCLGVCIMHARGDWWVCLDVSVPFFGLFLSVRSFYLKVHELCGVCGERDRGEQRGDLLQVVLPVSTRMVLMFLGDSCFYPLTATGWSICRFCLHDLVEWPVAVIFFYVFAACWKLEFPPTPKPGFKF